MTHYDMIFQIQRAAAKRRFRFSYTDKNFLIKATDTDYLRCEIHNDQITVNDTVSNTVFVTFRDKFVKYAISWMDDFLEN
jgi:uncharacterized protein YllA (UPF0747 family)